MWVGCQGWLGCGRVVGCCWVPACAGMTGVVLLGPGWGRRDDGGTEGAGRGLGAAWDVFSRSGECVQSVGPMCSVSGPMCSVSGPMCSVFGPMCSLSGRMCSLWRGRCSVFGGGRWLGIGDGGKARFAPSASSGQVLRGRRDDGDVSTLSGQCVQFLARCVNFSAECVQYPAECVR